MAATPQGEGCTGTSPPLAWFSTDRERVDLANALARGAERTTPRGREFTLVDGRWYYSDAKAPSTFLKQYGERPKEKAPPKAEEKNVEVTTDKAAPLAKLEERFILGEISEAAYNELKRKYEG